MNNLYINYFIISKPHLTSHFIHSETIPFQKFLFFRILYYINCLLTHIYIYFLISHLLSSYTSKNLDTLLIKKLHVIL
jgi:hypothetical protein